MNIAATKIWLKSKMECYTHFDLQRTYIEKQTITTGQLLAILLNVYTSFHWITCYELWKNGKYHIYWLYIYQKNMFHFHEKGKDYHPE